MKQEAQLSLAVTQLALPRGVVLTALEYRRKSVAPSPLQQHAGRFLGAQKGYKFRGPRENKVSLK